MYVFTCVIGFRTTAISLRNIDGVNFEALLDLQPVPFGSQGPCNQHQMCVISMTLSIPIPENSVVTWLDPAWWQWQSVGMNQRIDEMKVKKQI